MGEEDAEGQGAATDSPLTLSSDRLPPSLPMRYIATFFPLTSLILLLSTPSPPPRTPPIRFPPARPAPHDNTSCVVAHYVSKHSPLTCVDGRRWVR
eukprot:3303704-Rhodomonas_salina.1